MIFVTIAGNEYSKSVIQGMLATSTIYRVKRTNVATGKVTWAVLDRQINRRLIARIEATLAR